MSTEEKASSSSRELITVNRVFEAWGKSIKIPVATERNQFICDFICGTLKPDRVERGRVSCIVRVIPAAANVFGGMHGGAVASVAETISVACARTVVSEDKDLFLGELSTCYLSAAPANAELKVDASVIKTGRNLTVVAADFRLKDSNNLTYTSRAIFYTIPISSL